MPQRMLMSCCSGRCCLCPSWKMLYRCRFSVGWCGSGRLLQPLLQRLLQLLLQLQQPFAICGSKGYCTLEQQRMLQLLVIRLLQLLQGQKGEGPRGRGRVDEVEGTGGQGQGAKNKGSKTRG